MNHNSGHIHHSDHDHDGNDAMDSTRQRTNSSSLASNDDTQCEMDLRQDYTNAVDCLVSCEFIIKTLQQQLAEQLAAKDVELASKDETIASLENKIVDMSLELASTLSREEELQHRLQKSFTETMSATRTRTISRTISSPQHLTNTTEVDSIIPPPPNHALIAFNQARCRPISTSSRKKTSQAVKAATACDNNNGNNTTPHNNTNLLRTSFTSTATTAKTSISNATSSNTILSQQGGGWLQRIMITSSKNDNDDGTGTMTPSRCSNLGLGKIFQKGTRKTEEEKDQTMPLPTSRSSKMFGSKASEMEIDFVQSSNNDRSNRGPSDSNNDSRRPQNRKRIERQESSRSFLEASGVVFPVSSFEVLNKGCLARVISKGSKGALAHSISKGSKGCMRATSSVDLFKKGCMARSKKSNGTNEEWPEFCK